MKTISIFILLLYWSVMIFAPVMGENTRVNENKKLYNLSFVQLINQSGPVYINLLNDLSIYLSKEETDKSLNKLGYILTKDMNLLYIGLLILALSFFLWLISVTK